MRCAEVRQGQTGSHLDYTFAQISEPSCKLMATRLRLYYFSPVPDTLRIAIRVQPGASRTKVGGQAGNPPRLLVKVSEQPVDGKATQAAMKAVAKAFGLKTAQVSFVSGHTSKDKVLELSGTQSELKTRLNELLEQ